ncbi:hypothetical protein [Azospirillum sp.]|uniref:hypothetical protein n=1 Tax=Azospirillum sp. TaxID=34012 RepID=UPI002D288040|nr:hypothetical protein [Azospirillum sp.]HYD65528.1 hypothetical protein [Azospirillum sp.]
MPWMSMSPTPRPLRPAPPRQTDAPAPAQPTDNPDLATPRPGLGDAPVPGPDIQPTAPTRE